jgi:hypothetical protein
VAGLLLLYRRTVTAGLFAAMGAFLNVVMINLSYDVPVKLFSMHLFFCSVFLLALDARRVLGFMVLNQAVPPTNAYVPRYAQRWQQWGAVAVKLFIVYQILWLPLKGGWSSYQAVNAPAARAVPGRLLRCPPVRGQPRHDPGSQRRHAALEGRDHRQRTGRQREHTGRRVLAAVSARILPLQARHDAATGVGVEDLNDSARQHLPLHDAIRGPGYGRDPIPCEDP